MDKDDITRYHELQHFKQAWKGVLHDHSENIKASISSLQNESSAAVDDIINRSSKSTTS